MAIAVLGAFACGGVWVVAEEGAGSPSHGGVDRNTIVFIRVCWAAGSRAHWGSSVRWPQILTRICSSIRIFDGEHSGDIRRDCVGTVSGLSVKFVPTFLLFVPISPDFNQNHCRRKPIESLKKSGGPRSMKASTTFTL